MSYMDTTQFASKPSASIISFNLSCKVYQASFKVYKSNNEDRTVILKTNYNCIVEVRNIGLSILPTMVFSGHWDYGVSEYAF